MSTSRTLLVLLAPLTGCYPTYNSYFYGTDTGCCCSDDTGEPESDCPTDPPDAPDLTPEACPLEPQMDPVVEWQWPHDDFTGDFTEVLVTPVVGDVSGDGVPDVVFTAFDTYEWDAGALVVLSGDDGSLLLYADSFIDGNGDTFTPPGLAGVALGDLEGDGVPEMCLSGMAVSVFCVQLDETVVMSAGVEPQWDSLATASYPIIVDLDGSGEAEVIIGHEVFDAAGNTLVSAANDGGIPAGTEGAAVAVVADLADDDARDAVFGVVAHDIDGNTTYSDAGVDGLTAVGDLDGDGASEVVRAVYGWLAVADLSGNFYVNEPLIGEVDGGLGGPPLIADVDGDGAQDVVVASISVVTAYDGAGLMDPLVSLEDAVLWQITPTEQVNGVLGASAFDIDYDGDQDVIFADEETFRILEGSSGVDLLEQNTTDFDGGAHSSESALEYPTIVDLDDDGSAEILVASSQQQTNYDASQWSGVRAIGSASSSWPDAPASWPMHGYTPDLVGDDLGPTDPASTDPWWTVEGSFRAQPATWTGGDFPNLVVLEPELCVDECPDQVLVWIPVGNAGGADSPATTLTLGAVDGSWSMSEAVSALAPGEVAWTGPFTVTDPGLWGIGLTASVDPDGLVEECDEDDNSVGLGPDPCDG